MKDKLFTKSAFKVALKCPAALYYYRDPDTYANQNNSDEFLKALADGGFQVGDLAKIYCGVDEGCDLEDEKGYDAPLVKTDALMARSRATSQRNLVDSSRPPLKVMIVRMGARSMRIAWQMEGLRFGLTA